MRRWIVTTVILFFGVLAIFVFERGKIGNGKLTIVVCDVGQGDSLLIKTPKGSVVVVDSGPDEKARGCLAENTPFWHRRVDLLFHTHPHADHFGGTFHLLRSHDIEAIATEKVFNDSPAFEALEGTIDANNVPVRYVKDMDRYTFSDGVSILVLGPSDSYLKRVSPSGEIDEAIKQPSLIMLLRYGSFEYLLTGDTEAPGLAEALEKYQGDIDVMHVPHHGSRTGLNAEILSNIDPELGIISVGKNNYGHPSPEVLNILRVEGVEVRQTINDGDIEIVSDGKSYSVSEN